MRPELRLCLSSLYGLLSCCSLSGSHSTRRCSLVLGTWTHSVPRLRVWDLIHAHFLHFWSSDGLSLGQNQSIELWNIVNDSSWTLIYRWGDRSSIYLRTCSKWRCSQSKNPGSLPPNIELLILPFDNQGIHGKASPGPGTRPDIDMWRPDRPWEP